VREFAFILAFTMCMGGASVAAKPLQLSIFGADFGRVSVEDVGNRLSLAVNVGELEVVSTHAVARFQSNMPRKRTANGFWLPWDGQTETLIDLKLKPSADGVLSFALIEEDLSAQFLPIAFTVIVRSPKDVRWGYLVVDR
jgi:hypothetical protein